MNIIPIKNMCQVGLLRGSRGWGWYYRSKEMLKAKPAKESSIWTNPTGERSQVFLDIGEKDKQSNRVYIELMDDVVPVTTQNFKNLIQGTNGLCYKGCSLFDIRDHTCVCSGAVKGKNREGGFSSFNKKYFDDENFKLLHDKAGILTMMNAGVNTNSSLFAISLNKLPHLNGKHVAFGHIIKGYEIVEKLTQEFIVAGEPVQPIIIQDCGILPKEQYITVEKEKPKEKSKEKKNTNKSNKKEKN
ncbi:hypothetical protein WA158_006335 [Blastocystis sp. Blastoise]